jgi:hypothetical protein
MSRLLLLCLLLALASGCSGRAEATIPDGWVVAEREAFSVAHPPDWTLQSEDDARVDAIGEVGEGNLAQALTAYVDPEYSGDFGTAADALVDVAELTLRAEAERLDEGTAEVPGAQDARRYESTWDFTNSAGEVVRMRGIDLVALSGDDRLVYTSVTSPASIWDAETAEAMLGTVTVR